jgi:hypothetical protein
METVCTSETSANFHETTWRCVPESCHLLTRRRDKPKFHTVVIYATEELNTADIHVFFEYDVLSEPGSSVSIVSGYGLDDRAIEIRCRHRREDFSCSLCVQTGSGAHSAFYPTGTGGPSPEAKARPGRDADCSPLTSPEVKNE